MTKLSEQCEYRAEVCGLSENRLTGKIIVATRDKGGNSRFASQIRRAGATAVEFETIRIEPLTASESFRQAVERIGETDWVIFTSANGVSLFADYMQTVDKDDAVFGKARVAAIGSGTAARLREAGFRVDFVPRAFTSRALGRGLAEVDDLSGKSVLLLRSNLGSAELTRLLVSEGASVDDVAIYLVAPLAGDSDGLAERIRADEVDWVTFASPSAVKGFLNRIDAGVVRSSSARIASIGPVTSATIREYGLSIDVEASPHTMRDLLGAIESIY